jgi:3-hydroxybutyrate dehydrogenase
VFIGFDELAGITAFLMSPAARNITGQMIVVDGGWTAR